MKKDIFIRKYLQSIRSGNAAIFAGAGLSKSAGFVDWATLLKDVAEELGLDSKREVGNLPELAQFYFNKKDWENKKDIWKSYCPLIGILLIVLTLHLADNIFYQSDEWKSFMECNRYLTRGNIEDNPNVWRIYNQIPLGISKTNYCLTVSYCHDPKVVSVKDLQAIATSLKNVPLKKKKREICL